MNCKEGCCPKKNGQRKTGEFLSLCLITTISTYIGIGNIVKSNFGYDYFRVYTEREYSEVESGVEAR